MGKKVTEEELEERLEELDKAEEGFVFAENVLKEAKWECKKMVEKASGKTLKAVMLRR